MVERYSVDVDAVRSFYDIDISPTRLDRMEAFEAEWRERLGGVDFESLSRAERIDHLLLTNEMDRSRLTRERLRGQLDEEVEWLGFAEEIIALEEARWTLSPLDPRETAGTLSRIAEAIEAVQEGLEAPDAEPDEDAKKGDGAAEPATDAETAGPPSPVVANRLGRRVSELEETLDHWYEHYASFRPDFSWWTEKPYEAVSEALEELRDHLRKEIAGQKGEDEDPIIGDPIGREALVASLANEWIPYSPEELLAIGEDQFAWCEREMLRASEELGFGEDWKAAVEHVKGLHVDPGLQDELVAQQAQEAIDFLDERDLVTIPELCRETWRVEMLSKRSQRFLPFAAYGGQSMLVAYPTADMEHDEKLMALRGNNVHFTRAVTPHELIPGHHLQGFQAQRLNRHRRLFTTPFLGEGWALYWEMLEWDLGWPRGPEDKVGMLFWRMHRAARIIVSLGFHLERMTPDEMIDFLVDRVAHERANATSEVRRYVSGGYGPLYQCAYMIGGLQLRALSEELVDSGKMTPREFHDAVLEQNSIPVELIRLALTEEPFGPDHRTEWRFAGDVRASEGR